MSTKITISHNEKYHLYTQCYEDDDLIYVCIDNPIMFNADIWEGSASHVTVALPEEDMKKLCEEFLKKTNIVSDEDMLSTEQVVSILGVDSISVMKNWLHTGHFPGAYKAQDGGWRFPRAEVKATKMRMEDLVHKNRAGDLTPPDLSDDTIGPENSPPTIGAGLKDIPEDDNENK